MGIEPERKFLVSNDDWKKSVTQTTTITQSYIRKGDADVAIAGEDNSFILSVTHVKSGTFLNVALNQRDGTSLKIIFAEKYPTVRIRIKDDKKAFITIKGKAPEGSIETPEFEYDIDLKEAKKLTALSSTPAVTKTRHNVPFAGFVWEVDVFEGKNKGLILAEIELPHGNAAFEKPAWAGLEVTFDKRYSNGALSENPFSEWKKNQLIQKKNNGPRL